VWSIFGGWLTSVLSLLNEYELNINSLRLFKFKIPVLDKMFDSDLTDNDFEKHLLDRLNHYSNKKKYSKSDLRKMEIGKYFRCIRTERGTPNEFIVEFINDHLSDFKVDGIARKFMSPLENTKTISGRYIYFSVISDIYVLYRISILYFAKLKIKK
jgi:hypothetical protein